MDVIAQFSISKEIPCPLHFPSSIEQEGVGVAEAVGVRVAVGLGVIVGVNVGVNVGVGLGVIVGPNNCPGPQPELNKLINIAEIRKKFLFGNLFIDGLSCYSWITFPIQ